MVLGTRKGTIKPAGVAATSSPVTPGTNKHKRSTKDTPAGAGQPGIQVSPRVVVTRTNHVSSSDEDLTELEDDEYDGLVVAPGNAQALTSQAPPQKKLQSSARMMTIVVPPWVPEQMKLDLMSLHSAKSTTMGKIDLIACLRFYVRAIMIQKRSITTSDRIDFAVCFGVSEDDASAYETGLKYKGDVEKPWGVVMAQKFKNYYHGVMAKLRDNFDLLLKMFWDCEGAQLWIRGQLIMVEAAQQAALLNGGDAKGKKLRIKRGLGDAPLIDEEDVDELFLKGNMKLVSDVWNYILDVVEPELLLRDEEWGRKMLSSTCTILAWYITYLFQLPDPKGVMEGIGGIEVSDKTKAIHRGDLGFSKEWPMLRIPPKWGKRTNVPWYGELIGGKALQDPVHENLEHELAVASASERATTELNTEDEIVKGGYLLTVLEDGIDAEAERFKEVLLSRAAHLEDFSRKAMDKAKDVHEKALEMIRGMRDSRVYTEKLVRQRMAIEAIEQFCKSAWFAYEEAKKKEKRLELEGVKTGTDVLEVIGTCHVWMENMKKMGVFKELGVEYEGSFEVAPNQTVSRSVTYGGNSSGMGQPAANHPHATVLHNPEFLALQSQMAALFANQQMLMAGGSVSQSFPLFNSGQNAEIQRAQSGQPVTPSGKAWGGSLEKGDVVSVMASDVSFAESRATSVATVASGVVDRGMEDESVL